MNNTSDHSKFPLIRQIQPSVPAIVSAKSTSFSENATSVSCEQPIRRANSIAVSRSATPLEIRLHLNSKSHSVGELEKSVIEMFRLLAQVDEAIGGPGFSDIQEVSSQIDQTQFIAKWPFDVVDQDHLRILSDLLYRLASSALGKDQTRVEVFRTEPTTELIYQCVA